MAFLGIIATVASTAVSAMGAMAAGQAQAAAAEYNAKVQRINAGVATEQAAAKAGQIGRETRQRLAAGATGVAQSGFELTGSPFDVIRQAEVQGNLDYLTAVYEGKVAATGYRNNAKLYDMEAKNARTAGMIGAGSALLGGVTGAYRAGGSSALTV